jgi:hypothetical protein
MNTSVPAHAERRRQLQELIEEMLLAQIANQRDELQGGMTLTECEASNRDLEKKITERQDELRRLGGPLPGLEPQVLRRISGPFPPDFRGRTMHGRAQDVAKLLNALREHHAAVWIITSGGSGKSRLAYALAEHFPHACWHDCRSSTPLYESLKNHYNLKLDVDDPSLLRTVADDPCLLILDDAESATDEQQTTYAAQLTELRRASVAVVLTSRMLWQTELARPVHPHTPSALTADEARAIANDVAKANGINLLPQVLDALADAARQHPKLTEWAVYLADKIGATAVQQQLKAGAGDDIEQELDALIRRTYDRLQQESADAARYLLRLYVCQGGFDRAAALALWDDAAADPTAARAADVALRLLQRYQFVRFDAAAERYQPDPFAASVLGHDADAHPAHYAHYTARMWAVKDSPQKDYAGLALELANMEAAFDWAVRAERWRDAYWLFKACSDFLANRVRHAQRWAWAERLRAPLQDQPDPDLRADFLVSLGIVYREHPFDERGQPAPRH